MISDPGTVACMDWVKWLRNSSKIGICTNSSFTSIFICALKKRNLLRHIKMWFVVWELLIHSMKNYLIRRHVIRIHINEWTRTWMTEMKITSQPSNPREAAISANLSAYSLAESFDDSNDMQVSLPSSHSVMNVPNTWHITSTNDGQA